MIPDTATVLVPKVNDELPAFTQSTPLYLPKTGTIGNVAKSSAEFHLKITSAIPPEARVITHSNFTKLGEGTG